MSSIIIAQLNRGMYWHFVKNQVEHQHELVGIGIYVRIDRCRNIKARLRQLFNLSMCYSATNKIVDSQPLSQQTEQAAPL